MRERLARIAAMFRKQELESRLDDELRLHEDLLAEELGSRDAARRELGPSAVRDEYYDRAGLPWIETLVKDLRFGARLLRKGPGFAAISILTIALGIGATTAMFSLLYHVVLKPLPYPEPERLATVLGTGVEQAFALTSMPDYLDFRAQSSTFEHLAATAGRIANITAPGPADVIAAAQVSDNFFAAAGVPAFAGSVINTPDNQPVAVISHEVWRNRFNGDRAAVGRTITLDDVAHTIIGVMPPGFTLPGSTKIWVPFGEKARRNSRRSDFLTIIGRLKPDASLQEAGVELRVITTRLEKQYPNTNTNRRALVLPLRMFMVRDARAPLVVLFGAVSLLLVIACSNLALLMLARGSSRSREILIRASLGASRFRIASQLLAESVLISVCGAAAGVALAHAGLRAWIRWGTVSLPRSAEISIDTTVILFAAAASILSAVLFSAFPIRRAVRVDVASGLRTRGASPVSRAMPALVVTQAMLATTLLIGAGLLLRSLGALMSVDPGYRPEGVLTATVALSNGSYPSPASVAQFHERVIERLRRLPGVLSAATANQTPARGGNWQTFMIDGKPLQLDNVPEANLRGASVDYLKTTGIDVVEGRSFTDADKDDAPLVALVNRTFVRRHFEGRSPLGHRIAIDGNDWRTIVGVIGDVKQEGIDQPSAAEVVVPMAQRATRGPVILIRVSGDPRAAAPALRSAITELDPRLPVARIATLSELRDSVLTQPRFRTLLLTGFAAVALLLAALGVFGMLSYSISRRTAEIGVRMALGATAAAVWSMVLSRAALLSVFGVLAGAALAAVLARGIDSLLFGVNPHDAVAFGAAPALVLLACLAAAAIPARRATRVDPSVALRIE